ncbi:MAG: RNase H family protein [Patescibacteria group bacterium]|jgi:ribonuclease HI
MNPYAAQIYIDGSCFKNPAGPGGCAGILVAPEDTNEPEVIFQEGYKSTTNNRMELQAVINTLKYIKDNSFVLKEFGINQVEIWSDSETAIKCYQSVEQWRSNTWLGADDVPVKNVDLLKQILTLKNSIRFSYKLAHILNKSTDEAIIVDKLAKEAALKMAFKDDTGYIQPRASRTRIKGKTVLFNANGQKIVIRVFEHSVISRRKDSLYQVKFEIASSSVEKYRAYTTGEVDRVIDRWHFYEAQFNDNPRNPSIENIKEVSEEEFNT